MVFSPCVDRLRHCSRCAPARRRIREAGKPFTGAKRRTNSQGRLRARAQRPLSNSGASATPATSYRSHRLGCLWRGHTGRNAARPRTPPLPCRQEFSQWAEGELVHRTAFEDETRGVRIAGILALKRFPAERWSLSCSNDQNAPLAILGPRGESGRSIHAIGDLPCFLNRSLIASVSKASVVLSLSTAKPFNCLCAAGSSVAVTFFFPARVAA
jgi:hypothetical protein